MKDYFFLFFFYFFFLFFFFFLSFFFFSGALVSRALFQQQRLPSDAKNFSNIEYSASFPSFFFLFFLLSRLSALPLARSILLNVL